MRFDQRDDTSSKRHRPVARPKRASISHPQTEGCVPDALAGRLPLAAIRRRQRDRPRLTPRRARPGTGPVATFCKWGPWTCQPGAGRRLAGEDSGAIPGLTHITGCPSDKLLRQITWLMDPPEPASGRSAAQPHPAAHARWPSTAVMCRPCSGGRPCVGSVPSHPTQSSLCRGAPTARRGTRCLSSTRRTAGRGTVDQLGDLPQ
jgi:hypothetical protein